MFWFYFQQCIIELPPALLSLNSKDRTLSKNISYIFSKKNFSYILGNNTFLYFLKNVFLIRWETELFSLKNKKFQKKTFRDRKNKKIYFEYFSYFEKWNFLALLIFQDEIKKVFISFINWINQYYWYIKTLKVFFCVEFFSAFRYYLSYTGSLLNCFLLYW